MTAPSPASASDRLGFDYNPFDRTFAIDPFSYYARMRADGGVHRWSSGFWTIARYDDVATAMKDTSAFSNRAMGEILSGGLPGATEHSSGPVAPATRQEVAGSIVAADPPVHTELRAIVNRGFLPAFIRQLEPHVEAMVDDLVAAMGAKPEFDVIADLASALPVMVITEMLGVRPEHRPEIREWVDTLTVGMNGSKRHLSREESGAAAAGMNLLSVVYQTVGEKVAAPDDRMITRLLAVAEEGALSHQEAMNFASLLLFAGSETTTHLIGNAVEALIRHPHLVADLLADPSLIPGALEEIVRWNGPVQYVFRRATRDIAVNGVIIPQGADVVMLLGSANRDPERWGETADAFDIRRNASGHLGYAVGPHFCIGVPVARMEARVALSRLLPLLASTSATADKREIIDSNQFRGYGALKFRKAA